MTPESEQKLRESIFTVMKQNSFEVGSTRIELFLEPTNDVDLFATTDTTLWTQLTRSGGRFLIYFENLVFNGMDIDAGVGLKLTDHNVGLESMTIFKVSPIEPGVSPADVENSVSSRLKAVIPALAALFAEVMVPRE